MTDVSAMLAGLVRTDIISLHQTSAARAGSPSGDGDFAATLEKFMPSADGSTEDSVGPDGRLKADSPIRKLLELLRGEDESSEEDRPPAELATLMNSFILPFQSPPAELTAAGEGNDMEVNDALTFTGIEVQDELKALYDRLTGEKDRGVFLRILGKLLEETDGVGAEIPMFRPERPGAGAPEESEGLLAVIDRMIQQLEGESPDNVLFVNLPEGFEHAAASSEGTSEKMTELLPLLKDFQGRLAMLAEAAEQPDVQDEALPGIGTQEDTVQTVGAEEESARADSGGESLPKRAETEATADAGKTTQTQAAVPPPGAPTEQPAEFEPVIQRVSVSSVLDQIAESAALSRSEGVSKLELQLSPEFLGKISVVLTASEDGMTASIKSGSEATRNLLAENITALQNTLRDMGINMKGIEVTQPGIGWDFARDPQGRQSRNPDPGRSGKNRPDFRIGERIGTHTVSMESAAAPLYTSAGLYEPDVSVDYRA